MTDFKPESDMTLLNASVQARRVADMVVTADQQAHAAAQALIQSRSQYTAALMTPPATLPDVALLMLQTVVQRGRKDYRR